MLQAATTTTTTYSEGNINVLEPILDHFLVNSNETWQSPNSTLFILGTSIADELGIIPKEFIENGLHFTLLAPTFSDILAVGTQIMHHKHINFANGFDRLLFGYMLPETLSHQSYVRTFPGSKLPVNIVTNDTVSVGNFVVDLKGYFSLFDRLVIYYKISPEPK
ncbi:hypothetical protein CHUAL_009205 [Chamberlinius hualienensis]